MPQAVTHLLFPLVTGSWIKDWYENKKGAGTFSLVYALIAGIGGVLPDIDIAVFWVLHFFGFTLSQVHRTITHTLFFPLIFLALYFIIDKKIKWGKLRWDLIFLMLALGVLFHLILDAILSGSIVPFYPFASWALGLNLVGLLPEPLRGLALPTLDGALLVLWIVYLEWRHKISDFI